MPSTAQVSVSIVIEQLIQYNQTTLNQLINLMEKLESDLTNLTSPDAIQGEVEELLRIIVDIVGKTIETLLALQEQLQTAVIESYFPAQD